MAFCRELTTHPQIDNVYNHTGQRVATLNRRLFASNKEDLQQSSQNKLHIILDISAEHRTFVQGTLRTACREKLLG